MTMSPSDLQFQIGLLGAVLALSVLTGCGESTSGPEETDPGVAEAISTSLGMTSAEAYSSSVTGSDSVIDVTESCPVSGTIHSVGSSSISTTTEDGIESMTGSFQAESTADDCRSRTDEGQILTINTPTPAGVSGMVDARYSETRYLSLEMEFQFSGTVSWDLEGGPSGECTLDYRMSYTLEDGTAEGTVCGRSVETADSP